MCQGVSEVSTRRRRATGPGKHVLRTLSESVLEEGSGKVSLRCGGVAQETLFGAGIGVACVGWPVSFTHVKFTLKRPQIAARRAIEGSDTDDENLSEKTMMLVP